MCSCRSRLRWGVHWAARRRRSWASAPLLTVTGLVYINLEFTDGAIPSGAVSDVTFIYLISGSTSTSVSKGIDRSFTGGKRDGGGLHICL